MVSSPVNEFGPLNFVTTTSSTTSLFLEIFPKVAECEAHFSTSLENILLVILKAKSPLNLITAIPPTPGAVEIAQMVLSLLVINTLQNYSNIFEYKHKTAIFGTVKIKQK